MSRFLHFVGLRLIAFIAVLALITGCSAATTSSTSSAPVASAPTQAVTPRVEQPRVEHLAFSRDVSGILVAGENPHPLTHQNPIPNYIQRSDGTYFDPAPTWTQCSDFDSGFGQDFVAVIVGKVGKSGRYAITVEINEDNPAYTTPGTPLQPGNINSGGSVEVYEFAGEARRWQQVYGPSGQTTVIVLHGDRSSGTIDAWLATTDQSQKSASATLHVQGNWRCG